jgi:hypothetical protein
MSYTLYINETNKRARLHEDDCCSWIKNPGGGNHGYYRYFDDLEDAQRAMESLDAEGYDTNYCGHCMS